MHYPTVEDAARGDIPERYARVLDVALAPSEDRAVILLEMNEPPAVELYQVICKLEAAGWTWVSGGNGGGEAFWEDGSVTSEWIQTEGGETRLHVEWKLDR